MTLIRLLLIIFLYSIYKHFSKATYYIITKYYKLYTTFWFSKTIIMFTISYGSHIKVCTFLIAFSLLIGNMYSLIHFLLQKFQLLIKIVNGNRWSWKRYFYNALQIFQHNINRVFKQATNEDQNNGDNKTKTDK